MVKLFLIIALAIVFPLFSLAQANTSDTTTQRADSTNVDSVARKKNVFSGSINYQSRLHYFGRTDRLKSSGFFPALGYETKWGPYIQATAVFVENMETPMNFTGAAVELGYKFPESKHFEGNIFTSKFLYSSNSQLVQSAFQAQAGVNLSYKNKIVNITGGTDLKFGSQADIGVTGTLDHLFMFKFKKPAKSALAIMPTATVNAGTQNFTHTYQKNTGGFLGLPLTQQQSQQTTEQVKQFNLLAYEFSVPVVFVKGKLNAFVIPAYVIPQNLVTYSDRPSDSEQGTSMFYVTLGAGFRL